MSTIRLGLATALVAATVVPGVAHAGFWCRPQFAVDKSTTPPTVEYKGMLCY